MAEEVRSNMQLLANVCTCCPFYCCIFTDKGAKENLAGEVDIVDRVYIIFVSKRTRARNLFTMPQAKRFADKAPILKPPFVVVHAQVGTKHLKSNIFKSFGQTGQILLFT